MAEERQTTTPKEDERILGNEDNVNEYADKGRSKRDTLSADLHYGVAIRLTRSYPKVVFGAYITSYKKRWHKFCGDGFAVKQHRYPSLIVSDSQCRTLYFHSR